MTVRVGIVGCGLIGGAHSRVLRGLIEGGLVDAEVVGACDVDRDRAVAFAKAHGASLATDVAENLIDAADAVWVCTPTSTHRPLVELVAAAGKAVFCEKPLAPALADVAAMTEAVTRAGVVHQVGLVLRWSEPFVELRRLTGGGDVFGRPMAAVFRDDQYFPVQGRYGSSWRADVALAGGGTLIEHSIHDLDLLIWLLGDVSDVACRTANFAGHLGVEDVAVATLTHATGATSSLVSVWHQVLSRPSLRRLEVFCERALLWLDDDIRGPVRVERESGSYEVATPTGEGWLHRVALPEDWRVGAAPYAAANQAFLRAVVGGDPAWPGFEVALAAHRVADAAYRSAAAGGGPTPVALL